MSTRGFIGIRNNKKLLSGMFNHWDSYYSAKGAEVVKEYFAGNGNSILYLAQDGYEDKEFLYDGLFCEYAYIYNIDNDTLEIYRGFFKIKQSFDRREQIVNELERQPKDVYFCHLIIIIDRKKHTREEVLKAFEKYDKSNEGKNDIDCYPERDIIKLEIPKGYKLIV